MAGISVADRSVVAATTETTTCALCQKVMAKDEARRGQPFITARQLASTIFSTALRSPSLLGDILFKEMDQVDYCAECREIVAERRQSEQLKFLFGMLLILAIVIGIPLLLLLN